MASWADQLNFGAGSMGTNLGYSSGMTGLAPSGSSSMYSFAPQIGASDLSQFGLGTLDTASLVSASPTLTRNFGSSVSSATSGSNPGDGGGDSKGWFDSIGGGEGLGAILKGIGQLGSVWAAIQANKIAKDSLKFQKDAYKTNLANQTKSYNTALEGRAQLRFSQEGNLGAKDDYLNNNRL